jgi:cytochrome c peroxidase
LLASVLAAGSCCLGQAEPTHPTGNPTLGLPPIPISDGAPVTQIELGRRLFFDRRLSADGSISCANCHVPEKAYTDGRPVAQGIAGQTGTRNTISLLNVAYQQTLFWDGRRESLEAQAADPFLNPREHGLATSEQLLEVIGSDAKYARAFGTKRPSLAQVTAALAAFERSLIAGGSAFDRYYYGKEERALAPSAKRGLRLFQGRAQCASCHTIDEDGATLADGKFHSAGVGIKKIEAHLGALATRVVSATDAELARLVVGEPDIAALGRFVVTRKLADIGQYKTPSLRNVELTGPYMHDGSVATLEEAVERELYYRSAQLTHPIVLTEDEKADLIAFLRALTSPSWPLGPSGASVVDQAILMPANAHSTILKHP